MKVKSGFTISNKKKNALPTLKLLKPKQFKLKQANDKKKITLGKEKIDLAIKADVNLVYHVPKGNVQLDDELIPNRHSLLVEKKKSRKKGSLDYIGLEDKVSDSNSFSKKKLKDEVSSNFRNNTSTQPFQGLSLGTDQTKQRKIKIYRPKSSESKAPESQQFQTNTRPIQDKGESNEIIGKVPTHSLLNSNKVSAAVASLLKLLSDKAGDKTDLLNIAEPVFLQVECIKIPICQTKQLRFKLPHPLVNESSDILLITPDKKGAKIHPERAVEHYKGLLAQHNIDYIREVMPLRMVRQEYSQYEMRRKLVNQFDLILVAATVTKMVAKALGGFALYNPKMPIPVYLNNQDLKEHLKTAISKTQMTVKPNGHVSSVKVGHSQMSASDIAENIIVVSKRLEEMYPGGWSNIRSLNIKGVKSVALPVYLSLVSPNAVRIPVAKPAVKDVVEGELSTIPGANVVVKPDGTVILKKGAEETLIDDSQDDEILQEAEKYMQSSKTVRYGESDEDSDKEADAITEAVEQQFLKSARVEKKDGDENVEEEGEEDESSDDDEEEVLPISNKKRKLETQKIQRGGKLSKKKQKNADPQDKPKGQKSQGGPNPGVGNVGVNQRRGTRGGKKNKVNKDQRKALIKRKKAGKK